MKIICVIVGLFLMLLLVNGIQELIAWVWRKLSEGERHERKFLDSVDPDS